MGLLDTLKGLFGKSSSVADVNKDGQVNAADIQAAAQSAPSAVSGVADVNNDGQVNAADAQQAVQGAPEAFRNAADINNDGQVNTADAQAAVDQLKDQLPK